MIVSSLVLLRSGAVVCTDGMQRRHIAAASGTAGDDLFGGDLAYRGERIAPWRLRTAMPFGAS